VACLAQEGLKLAAVMEVPALHFQTDFLLHDHTKVHDSDELDAASLDSALRGDDPAEAAAAAAAAAAATEDKKFAKPSRPGGGGRRLMK
jgi:hypothetical protein